MANLPKLLCGNAEIAGTGKIALAQLFCSLSNFSERAINYLQTVETEDVKTFGPFCGRVILENGCAALVGRLDPFRLIYLSEFQSQPEYALGKRIKSAFAWTGDVMPDDKSNPNQMWDVDHELPKISRSLLSKHVDHIYWKPALENLLDYISGRTDPELTGILSIDIENHINSTRGRLAQIYSSLSKGVHWEFFNSTLQMDEITIKVLLRDTLIHVADLALASHFVPTAYASIDQAAAVNEYIEFRKEVA